MPCVVVPASTAGVLDGSEFPHSPRASESGPGAPDYGPSDSPSRDAVTEIILFSNVFEPPVSPSVTLISNKFDSKT